MKKYLIIIYIAIYTANVGYSQCNDELIQKCYPSLKTYTFLKSLPIKMKKSKKGDPPAIMKKAFVFDKNITYKISACNAAEYAGKVVVEIYDDKGMIGSTLDKKTGVISESINFDCKYAGVYYIVCYFKDGLEGCSVAIVSSLIKQYGDGAAAPN